MVNALDPGFLRDLRNVLLTSPYFRSDAALYALFVDARIASWRYRCKASSDISERVNFLIDVLYNDANAQGENALALFLAVLRDQYNPGDARYGEFEQLLQSLDTGLKEVRTQPINIPFVNRETEIEWIKKESGLMQYWVIYAPPGYGKTTFLNEVVQHYLLRKWICVELEISKEYTPKLRPLVETIIQALGAKVTLKGTATPKDMGYELARCIPHLNIPGNGNSSLAKTRGYGVVLALDNVDALDDKTLEQFLSIIAEVYKHLSDGTFFLNHHHFCLFMVSRNPRRIIESSKYNVIIRELGLSPYTYKYVQQTIIYYTLQVNMPAPLSEAKVQEIASKLMYYSGGHPGCLANLLTPLAREHFTGYSYVLSNKERITKPVFDVLNDLKTTLPIPNLFSVMEALSIFRRIDRALLSRLVDLGLISWKESVIKLERKLSTAHLSRDKKGALKDSITQRLLLIHFRTARAEEFVKICQSGVDFYEERLTGPCPYAVSDALEYLYLCVHKACHIEDVDADVLEDLINQKLLLIVTWFKKVWNPEDARILIYQLGQELLVDWELEFLANYFLNPDHYQSTHFRDIVTEFNAQHPLEDAVEMKRRSFQLAK